MTCSSFETAGGGSDYESLVRSGRGAARPIDGRPGRRRLPMAFRYAGASAVVSVAASRGRDRRAHGDACAGQNPGALAGSEAWRPQPVVDLPRHGEAVECRRREEQAGVVLEAVRCRVDVAFDGRDDAVAVLVHSGDLGRVRIEEPSLQVHNGRFERRRSFIDIQKAFVAHAAWTPPLTELPLSILGVAI